MIRLMTQGHKHNHMPQSSYFDNLERNEQEFNELLVRFSNEDQTLLAEAYSYAKQMHEGQERDGGTPYIIHPLRAAISLIAEVKIDDAEIVIATLLHDVVEDTPATLEEIEKKYGARVRSLVKDLTRERPENETEEQKRISKPLKFKWFIEEAPVESALIKAADLLDNLRSWWSIPVGHKSEQKFPRWFGETYEWNLPLAEKASPAMVELFHKELQSFGADDRFKEYINN